MRARPDPRLQLQFAVGFAPEIAGIRRLIRSRNIDLVLAAGLVNPHAAIAGRLEQIPVVWQILDSRTPAMLRSILMPLASHVADALMFTGHRVMDAHIGSRRVDIPTFVYAPPVATDSFRPSNERRLATRRSLNIPEEAPLVGMVANLNRQKGIEYFIRAAALLHAASPAVHFLVVGSLYPARSRYSRLLQDELTKASVPSKQFIFMDARPDLENCYPAMDVNLVTAVPRSEGITTTALEAMACSVPVIATDVGALREVVFDGKNGFLVPPLDPEAIASATTRLLGDPALRARMGAEGRRQAVDHYDVRVCTDIHLAAFEAAIQHNTTRSRAARAGR
jgi:glycosyltransferase involved in cell wall biosynthesis